MMVEASAGLSTFTYYWHISLTWGLLASTVSLSRACVPLCLTHFSSDMQIAGAKNNPGVNPRIYEPYSTIYSRAIR